MEALCGVFLSGDHNIFFNTGPREGEVRKAFFSKGLGVAIKKRSKDGGASGGIDILSRGEFECLFAMGVCMLVECFIDLTLKVVKRVALAFICGS